VPLGRALARIEPHIPILVAKCALSRPADDVETHTPRHWKDAASRKIHLVAIESRSCFSLWKVNQKDHNLCAAATVEQLGKKSSPGSIILPIPKQTDLPISYNIAPSQKVLTIRFNPKSQQRSLDALQWGLIPYWAKDPKIAYRTINARA
jgi:hypothetical protein